MKKFMVLATVGLLIPTTFLTSCNSGTKDEANGGTEVSDNANATTETKPAEGGTITVGRWGGNDVETSGFQKVCADFTEATGIEVVEKVYSDYNMELQTELIGGTAPDVFYVEAYMAPFLINQGVLAPLTDSDYGFDKFYPNLVDSFKGDDGNYYALPKDYSTLALYYNKAYVNEADIPTSLEELYNSDFLTELQVKMPAGSTAMTYEQELTRNMFMAQNGGVSITDDEKIYSTLENPQIVENLTPLFDAAGEGKVKTVQDLGVGWNGDAFGNGKTAIMLEGNWVIGFLNENFPDIDYGVMEIPAYKGEKGTMTFTVGYAMNSNSKNPELGKEFIKYATGEQGMETWSSIAGVLPARPDVVEKLDLTADPVMAAHIAGADYATAWQKGVTLETINNTYKNYIPSVVNGERTLQEALALIDKEANEVIKNDIQ